jgi:uncharacterized protein YcbX
MPITIAGLCRYPIKSLSAEALTRVVVTPGRALPGDRRFALRHAKSSYDPAAPSWQRKREFAVLVHNADLARLQTSFDADTGTLRIALGGQTLFVGNVASAAARRGAEAVINSVVKDARGPLQLVDAGAVALTDQQVPYLSLINLATLRELSARAGAELDPARFRGNVLVDGLAPWAEFDWVGRRLTAGGVALKVIKRIDRCMATAVNPATAQRDVDTLTILREHYGHIDCGVFAEVETGGELRVGQALTVS